MEVGRRERMTESRQSKSYRWWFESHNSPSSSHWLQSTLSELDEKTQAMLTIIEEDADSFAQRAEMYYKKRPILVNMVEDFYRAHRSLAEQFDNLRHDPGARRTSPIARSFSIPKAEPTTPLSDPHKSYDGCLSRLIFNSADGHNFSTFSKGRVEKVMMDHPLKSIDGPFIELGYGSEEEVSSVGSEVDDPVPEFFHGAAGFGEEFLSDGSSNGDDEVKVVLREEIERLLKENAMQKIQLNQKEKVINELSRKISDKTDEVVEMREEIERLRVENAEIYLLKRKDDDDGEEDRQALKLYCSKDEVEKLKDEVEKLREENTDLNSLLKKRDDEKREVTEQTETDVIMKLKEEVEQLRAEKANLTKLRDAELNGLRGTLEVMKMENLVQRELLEQKDEEKREVIRQLTMAIEFQKGENSALKNSSARRGDKKKNHNLDIASGLKGFAKLFGWSQQGCVVPL